MLVQRAGNPLKGWWSLPGGLVETGETLEEAVCREVREETGLRVRVARFYGVFQRIMRDSKGRAEYHYLLADYVCKVIGGPYSQVPRGADDVSCAEWVPMARLKDYLITEGTRAVIEEAYAK